MTLRPKEPATELGQRSRQQYLVQARQVVSETDLDYPTLYERFAQNDWAAVALDHAIAVASLKAELDPKQVVNMLHQGPYIQHQVHVNQVPVLAMSQYARGIVIQAMYQFQKTKPSRSATGDR